MSSGPLAGIRLIELAAIGPAPLGVMLLADLGADVIRIDRATSVTEGPGMEATMLGLHRNRRSIGVDLKHPRGREVVLRLVEDADALVEGFRPGVAERLGVGPADCHERNPALVYGRVTGWGQTGPRAGEAGHDIDYAAIAGALHPIGDPDRPPPPPLNLVADFGGGGTYLAIGVLAALLERARSGQGQVVDAAMVDGVASLTAFFHGMLELGAWSTDRGSNLLDGAAPYYRCYECADGNYVAVGAIEPQFYAELLELLGLDPGDWPQNDRDRWPAMAARFAEVFATRTRDEWAEHFTGSDACVAPVLSLTEAPDAPHNRDREVFVEVDGVTMPAPAPRLSRTPGTVRSGPPDYGADTGEVLAAAGFDAGEIERLRDDGAIA